LSSFPCVLLYWLACCKPYESQGFIKEVNPAGHKALSFQCSFDSPVWLTYNLSESNPKIRTGQAAWPYSRMERNMFGGKLGWAELLIILVIALIFFGPSKLGDLGKGLGDAIKNFKGAMKDGETPSTPPPADKK
jgi:sec-independent protein translocase protein TatA